MMVSSQDFGASFQAFLQQMASQAPTEEPTLLRRLREHFGCNPAALPVVAETFERYDHPNLHLAVQECLAGDGRAADVLGVASERRSYMGLSLAELVTPAAGGFMGRSGPAEGPVEYTNVRLDEDRVLACIKSGLYLVRDGSQRLALLIDVTREMGPFGRLKVEVMAPQREAAEALLAALRTQMRRRNVYRGHVISLDLDETNALQVKFHRLPTISHEEIILPAGLLARIERHTVRFTQHSQALRAAGRHLKRGLLLHGPPGTGKTLTAKYLAGALRDRTVLLVTGMGQGLIEQCCRMARMLQPSIVVVEDVDLIAEERTRDRCATALLFELLNQMDGLAEDADVLFLLTSNRPDLLEPALAARPGRVDQAIELPLPDDICRQRLFDLYAHGLTLRITDRDRLIRRTAGATGAFIRELLRKAALFAADEQQGQALVIEDRHMEEALRELAIEGGDLTKSLLGFRTQPPRPAEA